MSERDKRFIQKIKDILHERGWTTRTTYNENTGEVCFIGALAIAEGWEPERHGMSDVPYNWVNVNTPSKIKKVLLECANEVPEKINGVSLCRPIKEMAELYNINDIYNGEELVQKTLDCALTKV